VRYPTGWSPEDKTACYGALAQAFNLRENCATLRVNGATTSRWLQARVPIPVDVRLTAGAATALRVRPVFGADGVPRAFTVRGTWGGTAQDLELPIHDTAAWLSGLLEDAAARAGIRRPVAAAPAPASAERRTVSLYSARLADVLRPFLKNSINPYGESLLKAMGARASATDDLIEAGRAVVADYIAGLGIAAAAAVLNDGSGLSRDNAVTTAAMMTLLSDLRTRPNFSFIWEGLPIAGVDGTLRTRMRGTAAEGVLRGKTGTLRGVYNLSGYVPRAGAGGQVAEYVPFVVLSKTTSDHRVSARDAQDRVGAALAAAVRGELP
jgi:D-alanyl-D-alanine carboxypeptidase/D-alanyl-D-alanine-endopeptidase (penicillin-binding protein 4)